MSPSHLFQVLPLSYFLVIVNVIICFSTLQLGNTLFGNGAGATSEHDKLWLDMLKSGAGVDFELKNGASATFEHVKP